MWPNIEESVRKIITKNIEPEIQKELSKARVVDFAFDMVALGETPPAITGITIKDKNVAQNLIIIDIDLMFNSNGDIGFTVNKMKANVIDLHIEGSLRVVLKPLVTKIPLVGGVQVYFPNSPKITFDLGGDLGNLAKVLRLKEPIHRVIQEEIEDKFVLPNKFTKTLNQEVSQIELQGLNSSGVLRVHLIKAENLVNKDTKGFSGKSDPYAKLSVGSIHFTSNVIQNDLNPEWKGENEFKVDFPIEIFGGQELIIELFDDDHVKDDPLGYATIAASTVAHRKQIKKMWVNLENAETGRVQLSLSWFEVSNDKEEIEFLKRNGPKMCLLTLFIESCTGLKGSRGLPSPTVHMAMEGRPVEEKRSTRTKKNDENPIFEQGFTFVVSNPHNDKLNIKVLDSSHRDTVLGKLDIDMFRLLFMTDLGYSTPQPFDLKDGKGRITLSARLQALKSPLRFVSQLSN